MKLFLNYSSYEALTVTMSEKTYMTFIEQEFFKIGPKRGKKSLFFVKMRQKLDMYMTGQ